MFSSKKSPQKFLVERYQKIKVAALSIYQSQKFWQYLCYSGLIILLAVSSFHFLKADFYYDTDIARDMLLLEDMVAQHKLSLIGGRTSASGIFHGPFYYWLVLPFFVLAKGNPLTISWFWLGMYLFFIGAFYYIGKKVFNRSLALVSTLFLASVTIGYADGFTHCVLATFLMVPLIYLTYRYISSNKLGWLIGAVLTAGLIIQFQMAFGVPMLILIGGYTVYHIIRQRHFNHLFAGLLLLLPLSTFIVFDLRHDFIQFKSFLTLLTGGNNSYSLNGYWPDRWSSFIDSFSFWLIPLSELQNFAEISTLILLIFLIFRLFKIKTRPKQFLVLAMLSIFGFWIIVSPFKGNIWTQYYRPLLPVIILCLTYTTMNYLPRKIYLPILAVIIGSNIFINLKSGLNYLQSSPTADEVHWQFYRQLTDDILADSNGEDFGYYVFSPDQFGYQSKYALHYFTKNKSHSYSKQPITYLVEAPYWDKNKFLTKEYWQNSQVKIERDPDNIWMYYNASKIETYTVMRFNLTDEEIAISADPNLIDGIHFR